MFVLLVNAGKAMRTICYPAYICPYHKRYQGQSRSEPKIPNHTAKSQKPKPEKPKTIKPENAQDNVHASPLSYNGPNP
ncbi:hypothetical protein G7K_2685-t1 [Saitoella complicata NRRL Y-17804]|uniref:Uncharacterized protein n=1 Tax=Saitoella complicata (strain BCRC 22490 / CBS 7301 / JCM 7358 / NBRC 10748 / NRRL Y-17804) TaxID=698492 RepID=A0A0E9NF75_SAICN|nr:hypothetical protein G7K_2685-t1 [Saitoella complicata NRRL Y-17804]